MDMIPVWQQDMFVCCTWHSKHCSGKYIYLQNAITFASGKAKVYVHTHSLRHYTFLLVCRIKHSYEILNLYCTFIKSEDLEWIRYPSVNSTQDDIIEMVKLVLHLYRRNELECHLHPFHSSLPFEHFHNTRRPCVLKI